MRARALVSIVLLLLLAATAFPPAAYAETAKPFIAPVDGPVIRPFEMKSNPYGPGSHRGIDYGLPPGSAVKASGEGRVKFAGPVAGDGLFITLVHRGGLETTYSYLSRIEVSPGRQVNQGEVIAASGDGHEGSGQPALHFGAKRNGVYIDPQTLFRDFSDITGLIEMKPVEDAGLSGANVSGTVARTITEPGFQAALPQLPQTQAPGVFWFDNPPVGTPQIQTSSPGLSGPRLSRPTVPAPPGFKYPTRLAPPPPKPVEAPSPPPPDRTRIPTSTDPLIQAGWWDQLTTAERDAFIEANPRAIGRLEGVPPVDRDRANRIALAQEILLLDAQLAALGIDDDVRHIGSRLPAGTTYEQRMQIEDLVGRRRNARHLWEALQEVAALPGDSIEPEDVFLLEFDTSFTTFTPNEGKAVVAIGDPSKAEFLGVVVPGVKNKLDNFDRTLEKAANLRSTADRRFGREVANQTSTIAWLGYDTPDSLMDSMDQDEARAGAAHLIEFVENLRTLRDQGENGWSSGDYLVSVFGHSYGSITSAMAAAYGMSVTNLSVVGSPGGYAESVEDLPGAAYVWAGRSWDDFILFPALTGVHGRNPTFPSFGAIEMHLGGEKLGHSDYFAMRTTSVRNMTAILVGRYDVVRRR